MESVSRRRAIACSLFSHTAPWVTQPLNNRNFVAFLVIKNSVFYKRTASFGVLIALDLQFAWPYTSIVWAWRERTEKFFLCNSKRYFPVRGWSGSDGVDEIWRSGRLECVGHQKESWSFNRNECVQNCHDRSHAGIFEVDGTGRWWQFFLSSDRNLLRIDQPCYLINWPHITPANPTSFLVIHLAPASTVDFPAFLSGSLLKPHTFFYCFINSITRMKEFQILFYCSPNNNRAESAFVCFYRCRRIEP